MGCLEYRSHNGYFYYACRREQPVAVVRIFPSSIKVFDDDAGASPVTGYFPAYIAL